jgi:hypothetical protein
MEAAACGEVKDSESRDRGSGLLSRIMFTKLLVLVFRRNS